MKFTITVLALSLLAADAFMVQEPKNVVQPLNAQSFANGANPTMRNTINSPFSPGARGAPAARTAPQSNNYPVNGANPLVKDTANSPFSPGARGAPAARMAPQSNTSPVNGANPLVKGTANSPFSPPKYDSSTSTRTMSVKSTKEMFDQIVPVEVQGGSLKTCSFSETVDRVNVLLKTNGRPLNANVELWQGPDNSPQKMAVYLEDGEIRPFRVTVESPGSSNAIAIRNTGQMELPLTAAIECEQSGSTAPSEILYANSKYRTVQGGAVYTTPFPPAVQSVQIALRTDGRPLTARVELLQGPNNNKQVMEVYTEDGSTRPFYVIVDTPGSGNVVRIVNTATVEFPLTASAEPYMVDQSNGLENSQNGGMNWS